jgi:hypothetical protein
MAATPALARPVKDGGTRIQRASSDESRCAPSPPPSRAGWEGTALQSTLGGLGPSRLVALRCMYSLLSACKTRRVWLYSTGSYFSSTPPEAAGWTGDGVSCIAMCPDDSGSYDDRRDPGFTGGAACGLICNAA